ncbi:hypothetical protein CPB85DRAFT_1535167 [Mucidula mucida]|nr:hypothetical protein CPB85DRAFT_1535167 [Mucidula mucida]
MPDFEFLVFTGSEAFETDPAKALQPARDLLLSRQNSGLLSFHYGINEVEGVSKGYFLLVLTRIHTGWESIERHKELMADKEISEKVSPVLLACFTPDSDLDVKHFTFEGKLEDVTSAPDTEFALFRLQEGKHPGRCETLQRILLPRLKRRKGGWEPAVSGLALKRRVHEAAMKDAAYLKDVHSLGWG